MLYDGNDLFTCSTSWSLETIKRTAFWDYLNEAQIIFPSFKFRVPTSEFFWKPEILDPVLPTINLWPTNVSLVAQMVKRLPAVQKTQVRSLDQEDPLEKETATHSSTLAWKITWMEEPGGPWSTGSQRVGHDWATSLFDVSQLWSPRCHPHLLAGEPGRLLGCWIKHSAVTFPVIPHRCGLCWMYKGFHQISLM